MMQPAIWGRAFKNGAAPNPLAKAFSSVEVVDNHIYFYNDVDSEHGLALIKALREQDAVHRAENIVRGISDAPPAPIWLHLYSMGGDLFVGFNLADHLASMRSPVYSVVEGLCASAATLLSLSCTRRYILPSSYMLVHQLSSMMLGTHEQLKDEMALQEMLMDRLVEFYAQRTKVTPEQMRQMLTRNFWMDAHKALELGFVDAILQE